MQTLAAKGGFHHPSAVVLEISDAKDVERRRLHVPLRAELARAENTCEDHYLNLSLIACDSAQKDLL